MRLVVAAAVLVAARTSAADPITDRDYAIELYEGVAIGNTAWVGMGGAGAALIVGTAGGLVNPSAPAVRPTTDTDAWSWDYHIDFLTGRFSTDYDNNGVAQPESSGASLVTAGIGGRYHDWAFAFTFTGQSAPIGLGLAAEALRMRLMIAKYFPARDIAIGIGAQSVFFDLEPDEGEQLFSITGTGLIGGITYVPRQRDYRIAGSLETPILGAQVDVEGGCDPENCMGYILPDSVVSPARLVLGGAYRFAPTAWNQQVGGIFRDERALTLTADVIVTAASADAYGIEAFSMQELQREGAHPSVSVRGGAEYEWLPGRLRLRAGSYWEPSRFAGVAGRVHGTVGAELRVFELRVWGKRRRGRLSFTADLAERYRNIAASVGLWH